MSIVFLPLLYWPEDLRHPEVRGIAIGGCGPKGTRLGSLHAHAHIRGESRGWICFRSRATFAEKFTRLHELAHIVTREGRTRRWREFLLQIGGTLDAVAGCRDYHPRPRKRPFVAVEKDRKTAAAICARVELALKGEQ